APLALVLDDVDRGDEATIAALAYLQRRCDDLPVVIVAAAGAHAEHLGQLQPALRIRLEALTRDELDDDALHAQTGGHPQLVRAMLDDDPGRAEALAATLLARCRDCGP